MKACDLDMAKELIREIHNLDLDVGRVTERIRDPHRSTVVDLGVTRITLVGVGAVPVLNAVLRSLTDRRADLVRQLAELGVEL